MTTPRSIRMAAFVATLFLALGACGPAASSGADLVGQTWRLSESTVPALSGGDIDPNMYTIQFMADGTFSSQVDCNRVNGEYATTDGGSMTITPGMSTMAACPEGSLASDYLAALQSTSSHALTDGRLVLTTGTGTLTFT